MTNEIKIGAEVFPSKTAVRERCRGILHGIAYCQRITSASDDALLRGLFARHPEAVDKLGGSQIDHFVVRTNRHGTSSFFIQKADGSRDDFSFEKCL